MSRKKHTKKRNKPYTGADATPDKPVVHRYKAVVRSRRGEWWHENKRKVKVISLVTLIPLLVIYLLFELIRLLI